MELEYAVVALVFLLCGGVVLYVHHLFTQRRRRIEQRLMDEDDEISLARPQMLLGDLTPALAAQIPFTQDDRDLLQKELRMAGFYRPTALLDYAALRWILTVVPIVVAGLVA